MTFHRNITIWARGAFQLTNGRRITRTVRAEVFVEPDDLTQERVAIALIELVEELRANGQDFPEGHAMLVEILGTAHG
jgi:hypothetical protein